LARIQGESLTMADLSNLRVAFVHYWPIAHRGGERGYYETDVTVVQRP
jgi:hypothetical protein